MLSNDNVLHIFVTYTDNILVVGVLSIYIQNPLHVQSEIWHNIRKYSCCHGNYMKCVKCAINNKITSLSKTKNYDRL